MTIRRYQVRGHRAPVPTISSRKAELQPIDYAKGFSRGAPNDLQPKQTLRYVTDMRFAGIGKYITRKGCDYYTQPIGYTESAAITATSGAGDVAYSKTTWLAQKITASTNGVAAAVEINIKNSASASSDTIVCLYSDASGVPGMRLAESSIASTQVGAVYNYETAHFIEVPPLLISTDYWIVVSLQDPDSGSTYVSSTTDSTDAKVSMDGGQTWNPSGYSINCKLFSATAGGVKGLTRIYRPNGQGYTFFAHGNDNYLIDDNDGTTSSVDSSLANGASKIRYEYVNDTLYYVDGLSKPRKYDFSSSSVVSASPSNASHIIEHVGLLFYVDADDRTRLFYTNFADYDTFTSTDFIYVPAPKKSDYITALAKLNGVLYPFTRRNKHMLLGQDNATFRLDEAYAQKGTFSQESVVFDENNIYFASDDGVYKFNGTSEDNILKGLVDEYVGLLYKDDISLQLHNNRLYIWYRPNGTADTHECIVYNTLYGVLESIDLNTPVGRSFARHDVSNTFLQASNRAGVVYYGEQSTNDFSNLGSKLRAEVRTAYDHFGSPQRMKRIRYWRPIIETLPGAYTMQAGFAADYSDDVNFSDVSLQSEGYKYDDSTSALYDYAKYASMASTVDTTLNIYGTAYRWQRRYKHHAIREPFIFSGEELIIETQRLR